jgi:hypothetical protein
MANMADCIFWSRLESTSNEIGADGSEENSPARDTGKFGNGIDVPNYSSTARQINAITTPNTIMFDFWYIPARASTSMSTPFLIHFEPSAGQGTSGDIRILYNGSDDKWRFQHHTPTQTDTFYLASESSFASGEKMHHRICFSQSVIIDGTDYLAWYINGTRLTVDTGNETTALSSSGAGDLSIGNISYLARGCEGTIDNLKIYNTFSTDISNDFNNEGFGGAKRRSS